MVFSALVGLGVLYKKRNYYLYGITDKNEDPGELLASVVLLFEVLLCSFYDYYLCNKLYTSHCLVFLQNFQILIILINISCEGVFSTVSL